MFGGGVALGQQKPEGFLNTNLYRSIKHQEQLVRTLECEYKATTYPTSEDMIARIKQHLTLQKDSRPYMSFVIGKDAAEKENKLIHCTAKFYSDFYKFRVEYFPVGSFALPTPECFAFDGQVTRGLEKGHKLGDIRFPLEGLNRQDPACLLYRYAELNYSVLFEKGRLLQTKIVKQAKGTVWEVAVQHPKYNWIRILSVYDSEFRLVKRDILDKRLYKKWTLNQRNYYSDYEAFHEGSGETLWFPRKVTIANCLGTLPQGELVEWVRSEILFKKIVINKEIPDYTFVLEFPSDTTVIDLVAHQKIIAASRAAENWWPSRLASWTKILWISSFALAVTAGILFFLIQHRRRAR